MSEFEPDYESVWRGYYLAIQGFFYFAQGIAMGALVFLTAFLGYLSLDAFQRIVIQAVIWLPWYLKIIFGIISDNVPIRSFGRRKPYIILAGILGIIGWITLPLNTVFGPLLMVSGILASFGTSMSDATIDALAVDVTPPRRRGAMQGVSWGFRGLGLGIAAIAVGLMADQNLWVPIFAIPGIIISLACFIVFFFKENPLPKDFKRVKMSVYTDVFTRRNVLICMGFQIISGMAIAILPILQTFLEVGLGLDLITVGIIFMIFSVGMFLGALIFGVLGDRLSLKTTILVTTVLYAAVILFVLILDIANTQAVTGFFFMVGFANGGYEATQMRIGMDNSPSILGGTMYNLYNSLSNIGQIAIGAILIALLVVFVGDYRIGWQIACVFLFLALIPAYFLIWRRKSLDS